MAKKYPFKFLKAYEKKDKDIFFGRDQEIQELYQMTFQSNLMLVYGTSGTGKTSLIRCGLSNCFEPSQWLDLYIRREDDINEALLEGIKERTPIPSSEGKEEPEMDWFEELIEEKAATVVKPSANNLPKVTKRSEISQALTTLYQATFTPIYLIFDQFEELYTIGNESEQTQLIETIKEIVKLPLPIKIIIAIREEYLARLYDMEKAIPQLRANKLRLEAMGITRVSQVILSATGSPNSNVRLEEGKETLIAETIVEKIREGDINIQLPYLQIFMDRLYEKATGESIDRQKEVIFSIELVKQFETISVVLENFIIKQNQHIYHTLSKTYKKLPADIIWRILAPFTTLDGTKKPIKEDDFIAIKRSLKLENLPNLDELIKSTLVELESNRILRYRKEAKTYEVTHDILAKKIAEKRSEEEKVFLKVKRIITEGYTSFVDTDSYLSKEQLAFIQPFSTQIDQEINAEQKQFVEESRQEIKNRKKQIRNLRILGIVALSLGLFFSLIFLNRAVKAKNTSNELRIKADSTLIAALLAENNALFSKVNAYTAANNSKLANNFAKQSLLDLTYKKYQESIAQTSTYINELNYTSAQKSLDEADSLFNEIKIIATRNQDKNLPAKNPINLTIATVDEQLKLAQSSLEEFDAVFNKFKGEPNKSAYLDSQKNKMDTILLNVRAAIKGPIKKIDTFNLSKSLPIPSQEKSRRDSLALQISSQAPVLDIFINNKATAEKLVAQKSYLDALSYYRKALKTGIKTSELNNIIEEVEKEAYEYYKTAGERHETNQTVVGNTLAIKNFKAALQVLADSKTKTSNYYERKDSLNNKINRIPKNINQ